MHGAFLHTFSQKIPLVRGLSGPVILGIAARTVEGKEDLVREGYFIRELFDLGIGG